MISVPSRIGFPGHRRYFLFACNIKIHLQVYTIANQRSNVIKGIVHMQSSPVPRLIEAMKCNKGGEHSYMHAMLQILCTESVESHSYTYNQT